MRWTPDQYREYLQRRDNHASRKVQDTEPKHHQEVSLDNPVQRETTSIQCITVRFVGHRVRPLDPDNFAGSVKDLLDGLRHAGIIPGDEWWQIKLETEQVKVSHFKEEKTVIEIVLQ